MLSFRLGIGSSSTVAEGAPCAGADDRMVRRDAEADPVLAQDDLIDDLAVAAGERRDLLLRELGDVGLRLLLAPAASRVVMVTSAPLASEPACQAILPFHLGSSRSS